MRAPCVAWHRLRLKECEAALREAQVYGGLLPFLHDVTAGASPPDTGPAGHHAAQAVGARPAGGLPAPSAEGAGSSGGGAASGAVSFHVLDARLEVKLRQQAADIARKQQVCIVGLILYRAAPRNKRAAYDM